jgi:probable rRNA maturation factor
MMHIFPEGIRIPVQGGKIIEEFLGGMKGQDRFSVAHMMMPPSWSEESHGTSFDEIVVVIKGELSIIYNGQKFKVISNQVGWIEPAKSVIFSNENSEVCEYWAICIPAYHLSRIY